MVAKIAMSNAKKVKRANLAVGMVGAIEKKGLTMDVMVRQSILAYLLLNEIYNAML